MKLFCSCFFTNIQRAIFSRRFLLCSSMISLVMILSVWGFFAGAHDEPYLDAIYLYGLSLSGTANAILILCLLPMIPFATSFAAEWNERAVSFWIIRTGVDRYAVCKVLASALSGFLTTAAGMIFFILFFCVRLPLFTISSSGDDYAILLDAGKPLLYLFFHIAHLSLSSALFAVAALWVSTLMTNTFVAITVPLTLYFTAHRFTTTLDIPRYLKAGVLIEQIYGNGVPWESLLIKFGMVAVLILLMGFGTMRQIRRKVRHD